MNKKPLTELEKEKLRVIKLNEQACAEFYQYYRTPEGKKAQRDLRDAVWSRAGIDQQKYARLFDLIGFHTHTAALATPNGYFSETTTVNECVQQFVQKFIANVYPFQRKNFSITAKDEMVVACLNIWRSLSNDESIEQTTVQAYIDTFLEKVSDILKDTIETSNFHSVLPQIVRSFLVRDGSFQIMDADPSSEYRSTVKFIPIHPLSIAYDINYSLDVVGVYRRLSMSLKDIQRIYGEDFDYSVLKISDERGKTRQHPLDEMCNYTYITSIEDYRWVYSVWGDNERVAHVKMLNYCPFVMFYDSIAIGSNAGQGKLFKLYQTIDDLQQYKRMFNRLSSFNSEPIIVMPNSYMRQLAKKNRIEPGTILTHDPDGKIDHELIFSNPRDTTYLAHEIEECRLAINRGILGEIINDDPRTTATLTVQQANRQSNFLYESQGRIQHDFIYQMVQKVLFALINRGIIQQALMDYLLHSQDEKTVPEYIRKATDNGKNAELFESMLTEFVDQLVKIFGNIRNVNFTITSPIGKEQKREDMDGTLTMLTTCVQLFGEQAKDWFKEEEVVSLIENATSTSTKLVNTPEEVGKIRTERAKQMAQMQQQQMQFELLKKA